MPSIERRIARLEAHLVESDPPRIFVNIIGRELGGYDPLAPCPDGSQTVHRLPGEDVVALQSRCAQAHPGVIVWRGIGG